MRIADGEARHTGSWRAVVGGPVGAGRFSSFIGIVMTSISLTSITTTCWVRVDDDVGDAFERVMAMRLRMMNDASRSYSCLRCVGVGRVVPRKWLWPP